MRCYARYVAVSLLVYLTENKPQTLASNCVVVGIIFVQNSAESLDSFPQPFWLLFTRGVSPVDVSFCTRGHILKKHLHYIPV